MRPNDPPVSSAELLKSLVGALFLPGLLIGLLSCSAAAQTRLDASQIAPLKGNVQGAFSNTTLRDANSAVDHGNSTTNAIASAINDCGVTVSCSIIVPPSYGTAETVPGYQLNYNTPGSPATTPGNISLFDRRYSDARMLVNNQGYVNGLLYAPSGWLYNYYSPAAQNAYLASLYVRQWSLDGGSNETSASLNYADKTTWANTLLNSISHSPGQHVSLALLGQNTSLGDYVAVNNLVNCSGGYTTEGDLGCHAQDNIVKQGNVEYSGTLTGSPSIGATSLAVSPMQGQFTQGAGRFVVRTNAGFLSSGTISQIATSFNMSGSVTGSGTSWPVSTGIAQLGVDLSKPGTATVTPVNFTIGSMTAIQTTSLVCVSDMESFEMVYPTAVTATTFTANFAKIHPANAVVSTGGLCGYLLDLTADDITDASFPTKTQAITGTLHFAWPVIASSSPVSASLWVVGDGGWEQLASHWNATTANGYVLYPFAEVTSVQRSGGLSDNLTLGPNNVAWASGDTVSEFLYPATHLPFGNSIVESYYPNIAAANGFSLKYNLPLQGNEAMLSLVNNGPASFYASHGGTFGSPSALRIHGPTSRTFAADLPAANATLGFGCGTCSYTETLLAAQGSNYYDFWFYDPVTTHWNLSAGANSVQYGLAANRFYVPFANVSLSSDSNSYGYIATQQLRSTLSANTDTSGELLLTNAASGTQVLQGTYANHPECSARPQFDPGPTNRHWISYAANSFTVNFAAPVTGAVTYSCAARN